MQTVSCQRKKIRQLLLQEFAESVLKQSTLNGGLYIPNDLVYGRHIFFAVDNVAFNEVTPDGKRTLQQLWPSTREVNMATRWFRLSSPTHPMHVQSKVYHKLSQRWCPVQSQQSYLLVLCIDPSFNLVESASHLQITPSCKASSTRLKNSISAANSSLRVIMGDPDLLGVCRTPWTCKVQHLKKSNIQVCEWLDKEKSVC